MTIGLIMLVVVFTAIAWLSYDLNKNEEEEEDDDPTTTCWHEKEKSRRKV